MTVTEFVQYSDGVSVVIHINKSEPNRCMCRPTTTTCVEPLSSVKSTSDHIVLTPVGERVGGGGEEGEGGGSV